MRFVGKYVYSYIAARGGAVCINPIVDFGEACTELLIIDINNVLGRR
jgi:hypothetical protein